MPKSGGENALLTSLEDCCQRYLIGVAFDLCSALGLRGTPLGGMSAAPSDRRVWVIEQNCVAPTEVQWLLSNKKRPEWYLQKFQECMAFSEVAWRFRAQLRKR
jgi:hypothetical protein